MKKLIPLVFLSSCYMSYTPEDKVTEEATADSYTVIEPDSAVAEADTSEQIEVVDIDSSVVDIEISSKLEAEAKAVAVNTKATQEDSFLDPILFDVVPKQGCINKDVEIYLVGQDIHWESHIKIRYRSDTKFTTFKQNLIDECNRSLIDWYDLTMISFRTRDDLILNDEYGFLSGNYSLVVVNPDGKESNEIGLNLQYCGDEVEEIGECYY